jgi:hypothetical protein
MAGQYRFKDSNGNIVAQISASVEGAIAFSGSVVDFTQANNVILGNVQLAGTASNALLLDGFDSQAFAFTSSIHPFTASTNTRLDSIETISASNISRLNSLEEKTGSLATTGSNIFYGIQTFSGSLYVQDNLIVQGSSSLQNITASAVSIGTNIVYLNTDTPAVRFAGLTVQDSGSSAGVTGSILWDSLCNKWIYSNPSTVGYSGGMLLSGPRTTTLGTESPLTCNYIAKSGGGDHLYDSCITDSGTLVTINSATQINSSITGCGTISTSGTGLNASIRINNTTSSTGKDWHSYSLNNGNFGLYNNTDGNYAYQISCIGVATFTNSVQSTDFRYTNTGFLTYDTANTGTECLVIRKNGTSVLTFNSNSSATFANMVCTNAGLISNTLCVSCNSGDERAMYMALNCSANYNSGTANTIARSVSSLKFLWYNNCWEIGATRGDDIAIQSLVFAKNGSTYLALTCHGIANFSCQVCMPGLRVSGDTTISGTSGNINYFPNNPKANALCTTLLGSMVSCDLGYGPQFRFSGATSGEFIDIGQNKAGGFVVETTDTPRFTITQSGTVLVNAESAIGAGRVEARSLQITNEVYSRGPLGGYFWEDRSNSNNWYGWYATSATIYLWNGSTNISSINTSNGTYTALSDVNKKKDIETSNVGLNSIMCLRPTLYRMKDEDNSCEKHLGFIAQEVQQYIPQAYSESDNGDCSKFIGLNDRAIIATLVKGMQEQQCKITLLESCLGIS